MKALAFALSVTTIASGCKLSLGSLTGKSSSELPGSSTNEAPAGSTGDQAFADAPDGLPAFCPRKRSGETLDALRQRFATPEERWSFGFFLDLHTTMCDPERGQARAEGMQMRATIMKELGLTEADARDVKVAVGKDYRDGTIGYDWVITGAGDTKDGLSMGPRAQAAMVASAFEYHPLRGFWIADVLGDRLTELAKAHLVRRCLKAKDSILAGCVEDARSLTDRAKLWRELEDPAFSADERLDIKLGYLALQREVAARDKALAAKAGDDPAYKTAFFDVPRAEVKIWKALAKANPELIALARELDFGGVSGSRRANAGCEAKVQPYLARLVNTLSVKDQSLVDPAATPLGFVTLSAVRACARADGSWHGFAGFAGHFLAAGAWRRGHRTSTVETLLARSQDIKFDERGKDLADDVPRDGNRALEAFGVSDSSGGGERAIIAKVTPSGARARVTFIDGEYDELTCEKEVKTESWRYDRSSGELSPVYRCVKFGSIRRKSKVEPIVVPKEMMAGVAPGRLLEFVRDDAGASTPLVVWDSHQQKKIFAAFGLARKSRP